LATTADLIGNLLMDAQTYLVAVQQTATGAKPTKMLFIRRTGGGTTLWTADRDYDLVNYQSSVATNCTLSKNPQFDTAAWNGIAGVHLDEVLGYQIVTGTIQFCRIPIKKGEILAFNTNIAAYCIAMLEIV
jgi:hypothetical protein